ncbi:hypothetical protein GCM10009565_51970 [Amycolatopsis albidoflavus]
MQFSHLVRERVQRRALLHRAIRRHKREMRDADPRILRCPSEVGSRLRGRGNDFAGRFGLALLAPNTAFSCHQVVPRTRQLVDVAAVEFGFVLCRQSGDALAERFRRGIIVVVMCSAFKNAVVGLREFRHRVHRHGAGIIRRAQPIADAQPSVEIRRPRLGSL